MKLGRGFDPFLIFNRDPRALLGVLAFTTIGSLALAHLDAHSHAQEHPSPARQAKFEPPSTHRAACLPDHAMTPPLPSEQGEKNLVQSVSIPAIEGMASNIIDMYNHRPKGMERSKSTVNGDTVLKVSRKVNTNVKPSSFGEYCFTVQLATDPTDNYDSSTVKSIVVYENVVSPTLVNGEKKSVSTPLYSFSLSRKNANGTVEVSTGGRLKYESLTMFRMAILARRAFNEQSEALTGKTIDDIPTVAIK